MYKNGTPNIKLDVPFLVTTKTRLGAFDSAGVFGRVEYLYLIYA